MATKIEFFNSKVPTEIERFTNYQWMRQFDGGYRLSLPKRETVEVLPTRLDSWLVRFTDEKRDVFNLPEHTELSNAIQAADFLVRQLRSDTTKLIDRRARWRQEPASEKQIKCLRKMKMEFPEQITKGQAHAMMTLAFQRPSTRESEVAYG